jgi:hypothetical protein
MFDEMMENSGKWSYVEYERDARIAKGSFLQGNQKKQRGRNRIRG